MNTSRLFTCFLLSFILACQNPFPVNGKTFLAKMKGNDDAGKYLYAGGVQLLQRSTIFILMLYILPEVDDVDELSEAATNNLELPKQKDEQEGIYIIEKRVEKLNPRHHYDFNNWKGCKETFFPFFTKFSKFNQNRPTKYKYF